MKISFATNAGFLGQRFPYLGQVMLGCISNQTDPAHKDYVASFSFQPYPVISLKKVRIIDKESQLLRTPVNQGFWQEFAHNLINLFMGLLMLGAASVLVVFYTPDLYHSVFNPNSNQETNDSLAIVKNLDAQGDEVQSQDDSHEYINNKPAKLAPTRYFPEQNPNLPQGDWLVIPLIGVHTALQKTEIPEEALATGVWWAPDFGLPGDLTKPMIASGHRYGWQWWWKDDYWRYHSFYRLPELKPGDTVEVISDQRKWVYEIYAGEEGTEITDYQADLILYTCKFLNSSIRIFRYAKLIQN